MEKNKILAVIASNVRNIMNQENISSAALARKCKISSGTISKIINGSMSITIPMAMNLATGLGVNINDLLNGLIEEKAKSDRLKKIKSNKNDNLSIGILSISDRRVTCIKDHTDKIIGTSELEGGLDLTETSGSLMLLIQESIQEALPNYNTFQPKLKQAKLNLVTQSYEFEETRNKFIFFAKKYFGDVILLPDWQITYLAAFKNKLGISLITDKGVSLSYMHNGNLKKLGGWKFPVYDLGGENWLGVETIRHTIEAVEGYIPMSKLAHDVLAKFNGKIERITETCFKGEKNPDVYCLFSDLLLRSCLTGDKAATTILQNGFNLIYRAIEKINSIVGDTPKITLNGSLADVYKKFFDKKRLIDSPDDAEKVKLLTDITHDFLAEHGICEA